MSDVKSGNRQQEILEATLALVAEQGLLNTSISKISKQAKASPGIVYHYFENKDEIMHTLFENIVKEMMSNIMRDVQRDAPALERYIDIWLRKYHFHINHPDKTIFIEQYKNSSYYTQTQAQFMEEQMSDLIQMGSDDIARGIVVNLPMNVLYTMTFTVAIELAKSQTANQANVDLDMLEMIAERICRSMLA